MTCEQTEDILRCLEEFRKAEIAYLHSVKLEKQQVSLKIVSVMPELEKLVGALGFSELLESSHA